MTDLLDDLVRARMEPIRDALWEHGEITIAGLVRLDRALGIDTYNQCTKEDEQAKAEIDMMAYGTGYMRGGEHVPFECIHQSPKVALDRLMNIVRYYPTNQNDAAMAEDCYDAIRRHLAIRDLEASE